MSIERRFRMRDWRSAGAGKVWVVAILALSLAACGGDEAPDEAATGGGAAEGVSREEMVDQGAPMSLEEAESLGIIVDTTVGVSSPVGPDSLPGLDPVQAP
jgi:hypothetical protein